MKPKLFMDPLHYLPPSFSGPLARLLPLDSFSFLQKDTLAFPLFLSRHDSKFNKPLLGARPSFFPEVPPSQVLSFAHPLKSEIIIQTESILSVPFFILGSYNHEASFIVVFLMFLNPSRRLPYHAPFLLDFFSAGPPQMLKGHSVVFLDVEPLCPSYLRL